MGTYAQAIADLKTKYASQQQDLTSIRAYETELKSNLDDAKSARRQAEQSIVAAKQSKASAKSMAEMQAASAALETAKAASADANALVDNIEAALRFVPDRIAEARRSLDVTATSIWEAKSKALIEEAQQIAGFGDIKTKLRHAFVCNGHDMGRFLKEVFGDANAVDLSENYRAAARESMRAELGI